MSAAGKRIQKAGRGRSCPGEIPLNSLIPISSARRSASLSIGTSKQRIQASSRAFSNIVDARMISFLCTGPMLMPETGILLTLRKSSRASRDPSVLACTHTPRPDLSTESNSDVNSDMTSSRSSSSSSSGPITRRWEPAIAFSSSDATILTPSAALTSL